MTIPEQPRSEDDRLDETGADSFPASDAPSHSGITGVGNGARPAVVTFLRSAYVP